MTKNKEIKMSEIFTKQFVTKMVIAIILLSLIFIAGICVGQERSYKKAQIYAETQIEKTCNQFPMINNGYNMTKDLKNIQWSEKNG